jgi:hypothetical protein
MKIKFDPDHTDLDLCFIGPTSRTRSRSKSMSGGGFTKAQRCEYMDLCRQMTSRDPAQMTRANRDRLLTFLKDYVVEHSASYPEKREFIMSNVSRLFDNPVMLEDPNFLGSYNIVAFQCSMLFTIVSMDMSPEDLEICMLLTQLNKYELHDYEILEYLKTKRPLRESALLTGLDPAILDRIESIVTKYLATHRNVYPPPFSSISDKDIKMNVAIKFKKNPELSTITNESLEFLRDRYKWALHDLETLIDYSISKKYNVASYLLKDPRRALYFAFFGANIWNNYAAIRDITIKRQIGLYIKTILNHTVDMSTDIEATEDYAIASDLFLYRLYSTDFRESQPLYLITIISYIYIQEFVDAIVHNIYYCGLAYKLQKADGDNHYPYHFLSHDYFHGTDSLSLFTIKPRIYFERLYTLIMRTTFNKDVRYSILLMLFFLLHEEKGLLYDLNDGKTSIRSIENSLDTLIDGRWYEADDLLLSIPKPYRESEESINAYLTLSFKRFHEYFKAAHAMNEPLPNNSELSGSAKKLLQQYLNKEVSANGSANVNKMKRLLQTRKVAKQAAKKARKSRSRSHS